MKINSPISIEKIVFLALYFSIYIGFYFNEDFVGGALVDYVTYKDWIELFNQNFKEHFLNYDKLGERHSPITIWYLLIFKKIGISDTLTRLININIILVIFYFFLKSLIIQFPDIKKKYLILLSCSIFLSPSLRALAIWPDSRIYGLAFFVISIYFFLKFEKNKDLKSALLNVFFLSISSYISPNFSLFSIFFFVKYYFYFRVSLNLLKIICLNLILAFPAFYYLFILDVMFFFNGGTSGDQINSGLFPNRFNIANKIILISSIILFYLIPIISTKNLNLELKHLRSYIFIIICGIFLCYFFNYDQIESTGGGIFFHLSHLLLKNNIILFSIFLISLLFLFEIIKKDLNNLGLFIIILASNIQLTIYHKYYDPMLIIMFFTLFNLSIKNIDIKVLKHIFIFNVCFLIINIYF